MDVLIVPEARREIAALRAFRPGPGSWAALVGHRRGPRFVVEKVVTAGNGGAPPDARLLGELDGIWPGGIVGLAVVRPGRPLERAILAPAWYGKLVLRLSGSRKSPGLRAGVVAFKRKFFIDALPLAAAAKENGHE